MANGLFKYFPTDEDKLDWFANGQIVLTPPKYFNDPWDFLVRFEPWTDAELEKQCASLPFGTPQAFKSFRDDVKGTDFLSAESHNYQEEIGKTVGVVALTEEALDRRMWAHYGESHRGFVAEFRHGEETQMNGFQIRSSPFGVAAKVLYPKSPEQQPECKRDSSNIEQILWRKHSEWEYERGWRVVQSQDKSTPGRTRGGEPRSLLRFESRHLTSVIFGLRICPTVERRLREMLGRPEFRNVRKERAIIDPTTRKLISLQLPT